MGSTTLGLSLAPCRFKCDNWHPIFTARIEYVEMSDAAHDWIIDELKSAHTYAGVRRLYIEDFDEAMLFYMKFK